MNERYIRQVKLAGFGPEGQSRLGKSSALIIGCGGLGCPAAIGLSRAGIGKLGLVDQDEVSLSNLHRQILYKDQDVGTPKVDAAERELKAGNPEVEIVKYNTRISRDNWRELMSDYDVILDCSDNFPTRYLVNDACVELKKPLVYGAANQMEGQLAVFNVDDSGNLRDLFPEIPNPGTVQNCEDAGVLGVITALIGDLMALETIKLCSKVGTTMINQMMVFDGFNLSFHKVRFTPLEKSKLGREQYSASPRQISWEDYDSEAVKGTLVDVRTYEERERGNKGGLHIPVDELFGREGEIPETGAIIFYCQSGMRAENAAKAFIAKHQREHVWFIKGELN